VFFYSIKISIRSFEIEFEPVNSICQISTKLEGGLTERSRSVYIAYHDILYHTSTTLSETLFKLTLNSSNHQIITIHHYSNKFYIYPSIIPLSKNLFIFTKKITAFKKSLRK
jgi:hypothetical protein